MCFNKHALYFDVVFYVIFFKVCCVFCTFCGYCLLSL